MATGDELAAAIDRQRQVREAMQAEAEKLRAEREAATPPPPAETTTPPPLGGKVAP